MWCAGLVDPLAGGTDDVAAGDAGAFDVPAGLLAGAGGDRGVLALRIGVGVPVGLQASMGQGAGGFENRRRQGKEGRSRTGGAHRAGQADAECDLAEGGATAGLDADGGMDELVGEGRGDVQAERTIGFGQVRTDEDFEGAVGAGGAVPALAGGLGAPSGGRKADGDARSRSGRGAPSWTKAGRRRAATSLSQLSRLGCWLGVGRMGMAGS
jgi:hypothetical protein